MIGWNLFKRTFSLWNWTNWKLPSETGSPKTLQHYVAMKAQCVNFLFWTFLLVSLSIKIKRSLFSSASCRIMFFHDFRGRHWIERLSILTYLAVHTLMVLFCFISSSRFLVKIGLRGESLYLSKFWLTGGQKHLNSIFSSGCLSIYSSWEPP